MSITQERLYSIVQCAQRLQNTLNALAKRVAVLRSAMVSGEIGTEVLLLRLQEAMLNAQTLSLAESEFIQREQAHYIATASKNRSEAMRRQRQRRRAGAREYERHAGLAPNDPYALTLDEEQMLRAAGQASPDDSDVNPADDPEPDRYLGQYFREAKGGRPAGLRPGLTPFDYVPDDEEPPAAPKPRPSHETSAPPPVRDPSAPKTFSSGMFNEFDYVADEKNFERRRLEMLRGLEDAAEGGSEAKGQASPPETP